MYKWVSLAGEFELQKNALIFKGGVGTEPQSQGPKIGNFLCDQFFGGGIISATITFLDEYKVPNSCGIILYFDNKTGHFVEAQFGGYSFCSLQKWEGNWNSRDTRGPSSQIVGNRDYELIVEVKGSLVTMNVDGIEVLKGNLSKPLLRSQAGIFAISEHNIKISDFKVKPARPKLFVIMEYTEQFNELYTDVIKSVSSSLGFDVIRADESYSPGIIIADIERQIVEATAVIADITPKNPNVFYEVGFSHALRKPTILLAERETSLPFDVSPFRTLFYDNTIAGKTLLEEGLTNHIKAIQTEWVSSS